ncbi:MAG: glycine/betaine ABC transporter, partial [Pseudomonadota bacterium]
MKDESATLLDVANAEAIEAYAEERRSLIRTFVDTEPDYYIENFDRIGASARFTPTFNRAAGLLGPIWFGARGLWSWALPFLIIETLAIVQIARGLFGDLGADAMARIASIEDTLDLRRQQLAAAIESGSDRVDALQRLVDSLEGNIDGIRAEAEAVAAQGIWIALAGVVLLIVIKLVQATVANWALERRFS